MIAFLMCPLSIIEAEENMAEPPAVIEIGRLSKLYEKVIFDHELHMESYECATCHHDFSDSQGNGSCSVCHNNETSVGKFSCIQCHEIMEDNPAGKSVSKKNVYHIDTPHLKGAYHLQCRGCHIVEDGPVGCRDCHGFTAVGKKIFSLNKERE